MRLLLDTHVLIWWWEGNPRIRGSWAEAIVDPENEALVSAATGWELEIKKRSGKLVFSPTASEVADESGFALLDISARQAELAGSLDWEHRDPFDRLLVAQALDQGLTLITDDEALRAAPGLRVY